MRRDEYELATKAVHEVADLTVNDFLPTARTLIFGYDLDRTTVHVYYKDGAIHCLRYHPGRAPDDPDIVVVSYSRGESLPAEPLVPTKRAYPARTDFATAMAMKRLGHPLTFTNYRDDELARIDDEGYYGHVI
jgi:hypothetical protein